MAINDGALRPVPFTSVTIDDRFWAPRIQLNRERTIPAIYEQCSASGRIASLRTRWTPGMPSKPYVFWDSDIAKWIEAASNSLALTRDPELEAQVDELIDLLVAAQQPDGYLNTYFTAVEPDGRWTDLRDAHELYCAGHLMEAAVAHFQATGSRRLLDAVCNYADLIANVFGRQPAQKPGYCGHPEIELALVKLYRTTGEKRYLELCRFFIDERGKEPNYFDQERSARGNTPAHFEAYYLEPGRAYTHEYNQSHQPVREQGVVVGHAVRAMYLYGAMTDLALEDGDEQLLQACLRLWADLTAHKLYVTGGIGASDRNEGFTQDFDLPNDTAYCETCAAIGLVFWSHRLLHATQDSRVADVMELALYNGVLSGVSLDGQRFFYDNMLASHGRQHRLEWFDVSCCPANLCRLLTTLGSYIYFQTDAVIMVQLYVQSTAELRLGGQTVSIRQRTEYPWSGDVTLEVHLESTARFAVMLRIPGWCQSFALTVNGERPTVIKKNGYACIEREWWGGDVINVHLEMNVQRVRAHPRVTADRGRIALQRGPIVYCIEEADNGKAMEELTLPRNSVLASRFEPNLLGGVVLVNARGCREDSDSWCGRLYNTVHAKLHDVELTAIPYCVWDNRVPGEMVVWVLER